MPYQKEKKIIKIKFNKKNVSVSFSDKTKLSINNDIYPRYFLYVGKVLKEKDIKEIKQYERTASLFRYAMSLLKKNQYSEWKIREKLYAKEARKADVDLVIKSLKSSKLLDDEVLIKDTIAYLNEKNYGKNKIIHVLNEKGFFQEKIDQFSFPSSLEEKKALTILPKLEYKYRLLNYEAAKGKIYAAYVSLGYDNEIINKVINRIKKPSKEDEREKIKRDMKKSFILLSRKYEGKELFEKVFAKMRNKGYKTSDIVKEINSYEID